MWRRLILALLVALASAIPLAGHAERGTADALRALLRQYQTGNADAAAEALARWDAAEIDATVDAPSRHDDTTTLAVQALLYTDAAFRSGRFGTFRHETPDFIVLGGWGLDRAFEPNSFRAYTDIEEIYRRAKQDDDRDWLAFCRSWYVMTISYCLRWDRAECTGGLYTIGDRHFEDDPEMRLVEGSIAEAFMAFPGATTQMLGVTFGSPLAPLSTSHGVFGRERQEAEWAFRQVLKRDPTLIEARVRLGHMLYLLDRNDEAHAELTTALRDGHESGHLFARYLAGLFLGELSEHDGDLGTATTYYQDAVDAYPYAHTAAVALGQALVRTGHSREGWGVARNMFGDEGLGVPAVLDPWSIYRGAQYWQEASRLRILRSKVRQ